MDDWSIAEPIEGATPATNRAVLNDEKIGVCDKKMQTSHSARKKNLILVRHDPRA
jgi:hypothetical protein